VTTAAQPTTWRDRLPSPPAWPARLPKIERVVSDEPPDSQRLMLSYTLTVLGVVILTVLLNVGLVSQLQHFTAQRELYAQLRLALAEGSAPIGQLDVNGELVTPGTPVALLEIPELGIREVVVEGTASEETKLGVGHRRDTPMPGQPGVAVLMGRAAAYGGVFKHLDQLREGQEFTVTTGQGKSTYRVLGARTGTTQLPVLTTGQGRITLITATGRPFQPDGVLRVDADLVTRSYPRPPIAFAPGIIDDSEEALAGDQGRLFSLSWLLELLVVASVGGVWTWKRWSHPGTWIVAVPVLTAVGLACADRIADLLPNLL
jgi:LPXTG-site transpeptidase (sortase) family protein